MIQGKPHASEASSYLHREHWVLKKACRPDWRIRCTAYWPGDCQRAAGYEGPAWTRWSLCFNAYWHGWWCNYPLPKKGNKLRRLHNLALLSKIFRRF